MHLKILHSECCLKLSKPKRGCKVAVLHLLLLYWRLPIASCTCTYCTEKKREPVLFSLFYDVCYLCSTAGNSTWPFRIVAPCAESKKKKKKDDHKLTGTSRSYLKPQSSWSRGWPLWPIQWPWASQYFFYTFSWQTYFGVCFILCTTVADTERQSKLKYVVGCNDLWSHGCALLNQTWTFKLDGSSIQEYCSAFICAE